MEKSPRTPNRTPNRTPKRGSNIQSITPKKTSLNLYDHTTASNTEDQPNTLSDKSLRNVRVLRLQQTNFINFQGLRNFPNIRAIEMSDNQPNFSIISFLVALRSLNLKNIKGQEVTNEDIINSFNYSGLVTFALRQGMNPELNSDPEASLQEALDFLDKEYKVGNHDQFYTIKEENGQSTVTINLKGEYFSWYFLDEEFNWKLLNNNNTTITNPLNYPIKCEIKNAVIKNKENNTKATKSFSLYVPEFDKKYHVYAELSGEVAESRLITVKAPLTADIEWSHLDDNSVINSGTLVLPLTPDDVGRVIACDVTPGEGLPKTRLLTTPVKAGEFRFRSLRLQGELVEKDEIEFEVSTKGTRAKFVGIRILRSAHHGDWEHIDFISAESMVTRTDDGTPGSPKKGEIERRLMYKLTVYDIGCVIRAVCITEGGGPPLMLTSNERVQPSAPIFKNPNIFGSITVGMPLFAVAQYEGGLQGNCRYEWSIGGQNINGSGATSIPVIVPSKSDVGKTVACRMTPIRNDGSIGQVVEASLETPVKDDGKSMRECFLEYKKRTKSGRLQMSFVEEKPANSQRLFVIREGETVIISQACDWAVVTQSGIKAAGHSKMFTADADSIKGIVVVFTDQFFAIAGLIEASPPTASEVSIICEKNSSFITVDYRYTGGFEGRSIIQWNRTDGNKEQVVGFGRSVHIGTADKGSYYRAIVTPQSLDGKCGTPASSEPYLIGPDSIAKEEMPHIRILEIPGDLQQDFEIRVTTSSQRDKELLSSANEDDENEPYYIIVSEPLTNRHKVVWLCKGKQVYEGSSFTPNGKFGGKDLSIQIRDRLRETVLCESPLPEVQALYATVSDIVIKITPTDESHQQVTIERKFHGGKEGKSEIVWKIFDKDDLTEPVTSMTTNDLSIPTDESVEGFFIGVDYYAKSTTQREFSEPVSSELKQIPIRHPFLTITDAKITPNKDVTELICTIKTEGEGKVTYEWVHTDNDENPKKEIIEDPTGETTNRHVITEKDFEFPICCHLRTYRKDGKFSSEVLTFLNTDFRSLFSVNVQKAVIRPKVRSSTDNQIIIGQEIEVEVLEYTGIPFNEMYVTWQRYEGPTTTTTTTTTLSTPSKAQSPTVKSSANKVSSSKYSTGKSKKKNQNENENQTAENNNANDNEDENNWKIVSNEKTYITSSADSGKKIRAVFDLSATHDMIDGIVYSDKFTTPPVVITKNNPTIIRIASALFRTKKAIFDAKLPMGEKVTIILENGLFLMKGGSSVLLRAQYAAVHVEIIEGTTDTISLKARHGYNTELTFGEKKMSGGTRFSAPQARELFIETLNLFKQQNDK